MLILVNTVNIALNNVLRALLENHDAGGSLNECMIYKIYIVDNFVVNKNFTLDFKQVIKDDILKVYAFFAKFSKSNVLIVCYNKSFFSTCRVYTLFARFFRICGLHDVLNWENIKI